MKRQKDIKKIVDHYGESQLNMVIEELCDLAKEICKNRRGIGDGSKILFEIADVIVALETLMEIYNFKEADIDDLVDYKISKIMEKAGI